MIHENIDPDTILELAEAQKWDEVSARFEARHPADIALVIQQAGPEHRHELFGLVKEDLKPDVLADLEGSVEESILKSLTNAEMAEIVEDMSPDDAADVIADLSVERSEKVLDLMEQEESEEVRELLKYDEESAGGIMTPDVISVPETFTVAQAMDQIASSDYDEPFFYLYVVDQNRTLLGYIALWDLVRIRDRNQPLNATAKTGVVSATTDMDQEEVARVMARYDLTAIPVVDDDQHLVGRITIDDVVDVLEDEASEDIFMLAGSDDAELDHTSAFQSFKSRIPWLLITLGTGFVASLVLREFMNAIEEVLMLTFFVPIVMAMGGSTGVQSSTLIVRGLALGTVERDDWARILGREVVAAAMMGLICAVIIALWVQFLIWVGRAHPAEFSPVFLCATVGIALFASMLFAAIYGAFIPIMLDRFRVDPAVASGPFVTASNDIAALMIYYAVTIGLIAFQA